MHQDKEADNVPWRFGGACPDCGGMMVQFCPLCGVDLFTVAHGTYYRNDGSMPYKLVLCHTCVELLRAGIKPPFFPPEQETGQCV